MMDERTKKLLEKHRDLVQEREAFTVLIKQVEAELAGHTGPTRCSEVYGEKLTKTHGGIIDG